MRKKIQFESPRRRTNGAQLSKAIYVVLIWMASCLCYGCNEKTQSGKNSPSKGPVSPATQQGDTSTDEGQDVDVSNPTPAVRPKIVVVGWGPLSCQPLIDWMVEDGFPKEHTYLFRYSYMQDVDTVKTELITQFNEVFAKYPQDVKFDIWAVSTGHFTALYSIMEGGLEQRIEKFIGIVGIAHGINSIGLDYRVPSAVYSYNNPGYSLIVGKTISTISPHMNPFLTSFYAKYDAKIKSLKKCSIFSPTDSLIDPYDTGHFDDGENFPIPNLRHVTIMTDKDHMYKFVVDNCYKGLLKN